MTIEQVMTIAKEALIITMQISLPMLGLGLVVGIMVSIFQTVTSLQEQTLTFIPKLFAIIIATIIFGPRMITQLMEYTTRLLGNLHLLVK
jgi:flagellar biosynthetic protein FliQ